eukprot:scaffold24758_cov62-Phaeocystis_antarctica.AAC.1
MCTVWTIGTCDRKGQRAAASVQQTGASAAGRRVEQVQAGLRVHAASVRRTGASAAGSASVEHRCERACG